MLAGTKEKISGYLKLLVRCEEAVADFYRACATTWPEERAFWEGLADEEVDHAVRLELLQARVRLTPHGVGLLHPFPEGSLQTFVSSVEQDTKLARSGAIAMSEALSRARDLEQSLISSQPLRGLSFDDPRFEHYRKEVSAGFVNHARRILARLNERAPEVAAMA